MPNSSKDPFAQYARPAQGGDQWAQYARPAAPAQQAAPAASKPSLMQRIENWWGTPTPLVIPSGEGGWTQLPGTDVSPGKHIERALEDAGTVAAIGAPLGEIAAGRSVIPIAKGVGRALIGSSLGGAGGAWLGHYAGETFGNPRIGEEIGGTAGGLIGGVYGGLDRPIFGPWGHEYSIGKMLPSLGREGTREEAEQKALGAFLNKGYKNIGEPAPIEGLSRGTVSRMKSYGSYDPTEGAPSYASSGPGSRMTLADQAREEVRAGMRRAAQENPPTESAAGTRSLVLTPGEAQTENTMQEIAKRRASERGMQFAGGMTPREGRSVPRLPARFPATEYPGPREVVRFGETAPTAEQGPPLIGARRGLPPDILDELLKRQEEQ